VPLLSMRSCGQGLGMPCATVALWIGYKNAPVIAVDAGAIVARQQTLRGFGHPGLRSLRMRSDQYRMASHSSSEV